MKRINYSLLILICLSFIPLFGLIFPGLPLSHDGQDHVARIANFYTNLQEGTIVPRWAENLNWGYGHPILMFLYPLPSYTASVFHFFGFSFVDSVKLVFAVAFVASGIAMYLWIRNVWGETAGLLAGMLYMFAPYRFVDLYVRGAIGEHVAFVFPPLVFYFMHKLSQKYAYRYIIGGSVSLAGLILAHNAISLMFLPMLFLYGAFLFVTTKKKQLIYQYTSILVFGFGVAAFFWLPAFVEGKYTLRDIVTAKDYASRFVPVKDFFYGVWSYGGTSLLSKQVGLIQWMVVIAAIVLALIKPKKHTAQRLFVSTLLLIFFVTLFIMTNYASLVWHAISVLQKFQFPWRFLSVIVFVTAALGGFVGSCIPSKHHKLFISLIIASILIANVLYWHPKGYLLKPESFYTSIYNSTTDTGESAPIWSVRFMEKRPNARMEVIDGTASIKETRRTSTRHEYEVSVTEKTRLKENTLYFPGWQVLIDGQQVPVEFQDPQHRGLLTFFVEPGIHTITIRFTETKLRLVANTISLVCLLILLSWGILEKKRLWRPFR